MFGVDDYLIYELLKKAFYEKKKWQYMGTAQIVMPVHIVWHASAIARRKLSNMERRALENHAIIWIDKCKEILRILFYIFNNCLL